MTRNMVITGVALAAILAAPASGTIVSDTFSGGIYAPVIGSPGSRAVSGGYATAPQPQNRALRAGETAVDTVPDAAIWALMVVCFGLVGAVARSRKPEVAA